MAEAEDFLSAILEDELARALEGFDNDPESPNEQMAPNEPEDDYRSQEEKNQALQRALYGYNFPASDPGDRDWETFCFGH